MLLRADRYLLLEATESPPASRFDSHVLMADAVIADSGRAPNCSHRILSRQASGRRVLSLQPQYFGRNSSRTKIAKVLAVGLGFQSSLDRASQSSRWIRSAISLARLSA